MKKRKQIPMLILISVPGDMTAAEARREVRTLINHQSNFATFYGANRNELNEGDVKAVRVSAAPRAV